METQIAFPAMVKEYRIANNLTMEQLADKIGKTKSTISKWEKGTRSPKIQEIEEIAIFFGVDPSVMMFGQSPSTTPTEASSELVTAITDKVVQLHPDRQEVVLDVATEQLDEQRKEELDKAQTETTISENIVDFDDYRERTTLAVAGSVSAGSGAWQEHDQDTEVSFYVDDIPDEDDYDAIAIVIGHSMEPKIKNGDYLFIEAVSQVDPNTIGIFQVNGKNYVKKFRLDQNGIPYLQSLNPDSDDIFLNESDDIRTIGEVVEIYREG